MGRRKKSQTVMEQLPAAVGTDQDAPGGLKTEIPEENGDAAKDMGDQAIPGTPQEEEAEKNFETQRESIEELDPGEIQPFQAIPDYVEPTYSLYPIVVKTPTSITCIEGWSLVDQAKEAGQASVTCHVYHLTDASQGELAIRKVACRTMPQGGTASYAEKARNVSKSFRMVKDSNENVVLFAHGGARRGIVFESSRDENIRIVLSKRLDKSPATIGKYINHGDYINDEAMQILAQTKADKDFFESFQEAKVKLVEHMKGQQLPENQILSRVSDEINRIHPLDKKARTQEIKNLLASLVPTQPSQDTNPVEAGESEPVPATVREETEVVEPAREQAEEAVEGEEEEVGEIDPDPEEESQSPFLQDGPQGDQPFGEEEIRARGIAICDELRSYFANREVPLPENKKRMTALIQFLDSVLAEIHEA
ncbi:MAG: hypothetical protein FJ123_00030 [Deltaproteobacteria bacterium]|nr:hypothetical protein [Deltaproteobacteria bacterium]